MGTNNLTGLNIEFPIYNSDGSSFYGLVLRRATFDSVVMSLGDKITGDVVYINNALPVSMGEYIVFAGVKYTLVNPPTVVREGLAQDNSDLKGMTKYSFEFYHPMYQLGNLPFSDVAVPLDQQRYLSENKVFSWIGKPDDYIAKLNNNLANTQWIVVKSDEFPVEKINVLSDVLSFDKATIADALKTWYDTWKIPYVVDAIDESDPLYAQGKMFKVVMGLPSNEILDSADNPYIFEMGQGVGLKNNSRTPKNNKIVTRIAPYGSERNIPYGYPQIVWTGNQDWDYTINNASGMQTITVEGKTIQAMSYPIYDGIVGGQNVRLIKHPFTRKTLMPSIYATLVNKKVNPNATGYDPTIELVDYYDATSEEHYPNPINPLAPSYEAHEFSDIYPRLDEKSILGAEPYDTLEEQGVDGYLNEREFLGTVLNNSTSTKNSQERTALLGLYNALNSGSATYHAESQSGDDYQFVCDVTSDDDFYYVKYTSSNINYDVVLLKTGHTVPVASSWNDKMDDEGNYVQSYFKITLPLLNFDMYACASITEEMKIYMRSGACIGCTFNVAVDWDDYKKNFYDADGKFAPEGLQRDLTKYPKTNEGSVTIIVQKDIDTFGALMPNIYQQPTTGDEFVVLGISLPLTYITDAEAELDAQSKQYMLENNVYYYEYPLKFDEHFLAKNTDILEQIKPNSIVRFKYNGEQDNIVLYVKQMTVKYGQGVLPQYDITVTDDIEVVLNKIGQVTDDVSRMRFDIARLMQLYTEGVNIDAINRLISEKLSKIEDDTAQGFISFMQGIQVGERFVSGILGEGGVFRRNADGKVYLETDNLYVRMKAYFDTVEVRHYKHSTGNRIASNAGIHCSRVVWIDASGNQTEDIDSAVKFRCYFRATDGEDTVANYFVAASNGTQDLAFCDKTTVESGVNNRRYWRAVVGKNAVLTDDGEAWIDLSKTDCDSGSDIPIAGDDIIQLGNKTDKERQGAIIEYVNGNDAPSYQIYQGINSYSRENKNIIRIGFNSRTGRAEMNVYGDAYIGDPNGSTFVKYDQSTKKLEIKAEVSIQSTFGGQSLEQYIQGHTWTQQQIEALFTDDFNDIDTAIENIQKQVDGAIETWFYDGVPTLSNLPASQWSTTDDKKNHLGDLYYDNRTGYAYRFSNTGTEQNPRFEWKKISDQDVTKALADAAKAQDTADHKRRVFVRQPLASEAYDVGDLWVNATYSGGGVSYSNDVLRCNQAKAENVAFSISHWEKASKYTDDSALDTFKLNKYVQQLTNGTITTNITNAQNAANAAQQAADDAQADADAAATAAANAKTAADNAQTDATAANNRLNGWASDGSISPTEKTSLKLEWENVKKEYTQICNDADKYGVSKTAFESAYTSANNAFQKYTAATPENITIGADYGNITAYYSERQTILDAITQAAKKVATDAATAAANAQARADSAYTLADSAKTDAQAADAKAAALGYLAQALGQDTTITGGLVLSTLIGLRDGNNRIWSGINGAYQENETGAGYKGHGIAAWYGGAMVDHEVNTTATDYAKSLFRFDGSGYLASGGISWNSGNNLKINLKSDSTSGIPSFKMLSGNSNESLVLEESQSSGDFVKWYGLAAMSEVLGYQGDFLSVGVNVRSDNTGRAKIVLLDTAISSNLPIAPNVSILTPDFLAFRYRAQGASETVGTLATIGIYNTGSYAGCIDLTAQKWLRRAIKGDSSFGSGTAYVDTYGYLRVKDFGDTNEGNPSGETIGSVTSVGLSAPTGFQVSNSPITTSGNITLSFASGYSLPTTAKQNNWDTAYGWGNHANAGYLTSNSLSGYATQSWVTTQLGNYLPLTGGTIKGSSNDYKVNILPKGISVQYSDVSLDTDTITEISSTGIYFNETEEEFIRIYKYSTQLRIQLEEGDYASLMAGSFIKSGGTSAQFLKADGSVDSNAYITLASVKGNLSVWNNTAMTLGTLTAANGYTIGVHASSSDGGDWGMCYKSGQISMQLDGWYYQNEGRYRVVDTSDLASYNPTTNFKTINNQSIIGTGNINIEGGGGAPYDAEIEYLESTGTQYIDTGFIPDDTSGMYLKTMVVTTKTDQTAVGCRQKYSSDSRWWINFSGSNIEIGWNTTEPFNYNFIDRIVEVENNYLNSRLGKIDGVVKRTSYNTLTTISQSCLIFSGIVNLQRVYPFFGRIYNVKLSKGNDVVMDLIPVRVGNVGYMYDKVSGQLFGNSGTGDFVLGQDTGPGGGLPYLPLTGGTITGNLTVNGAVKFNSNLTFANDRGINFGTDNRVRIKKDNYRLLIVNEAGDDIMIGDYNNGNYTSIVNDLQGCTASSAYIVNKSTWSILNDGTAQFKSVSQTSDLRKKTIIGDVPMNLYNVANAPLFKFTWNDEKEYSGHHIGSAAQYWQTVLPELVIQGRDADMTLAMQYDVIALASAITVAKTVVNHEERIKVLENENKSLKEEIELLKK